MGILLCMILWILFKGSYSVFLLQVMPNNHIASVTICEPLKPGSLSPSWELNLFRGWDRVLFILKFLIISYYWLLKSFWDSHMQLGVSASHVKLHCCFNITEVELAIGNGHTRELQSEHNRLRLWGSSQKNFFEEEHSPKTHNVQMLLNAAQTFALKTMFVGGSLT